MEETFRIVPPASQGWLYVFLALMVAFFVGITWILFRTTTGATESTFAVSRQGLVLKGDLYGRTIPMGDLVLEDAKAIDLATRSELLPKWKRFGTSYPGYQSGWFTLRNGKKALLYLTDRSRVAYLPTKKDYSVLLSVQDPNQLISSLRRLSR